MTIFTPYTLADPDTSIPILAAAIDASQELQIEVYEDKCFQNEVWLNLGRIRLHPAQTDATDDTDGSISEAIQYGAFTWSVPSFIDLASGLAKCIGETELSADLLDKARLALSEGLQDIVRRLLLLLPTFDPAIVATMPFRTPTTLAVDTSAVKQGALDFVCKFLYPMARIKVPAVVPVEVLNMTDRFLTLRRKSLGNSKRKLQCLAEHVGSQGAQRALLRLEWHSEIEVERPLSGPDPLRAIFKLDAEFGTDNMQEVHRSLADRLVFESAKEHKTQLSPDHSVCVLTSDQGLARMVLSEGMAAIYFDARKSANPLGMMLTGARFHPLTAKLYTVSLTKVLWELATCFGSVRLACDAGQFQVTAMSEELPWFPYQSREDLLWCRWTTKQAIPIAPPSTLVAVPHEATEDTNAEQPTDGSPLSASEPALVEHVETPQNLVPTQDDQTVTYEHEERISAYVFSAPKLLRLIVNLARNGEISTDTVKQLMGLSSIKEYCLFLGSGGYMSCHTHSLIAEAPLAELANAVSTLKIDEIAQHLDRIPSFLAYMRLLTQHQQEPEWSPANYMRKSTPTPYRVLAEISGLCITVPGEGISVTTANPPLATFCDRALSVYQEMAVGDPWVLTGAWLEQLALRELLHPIRTRRLLNDAIEAGLLRRYTEGSTVETRFEDHKLAVLQNDESGEPVIMDQRLYHGDFLSAGRASVRIQLERVLS